MRGVGEVAVARRSRRLSQEETKGLQSREEFRQWHRGYTSSRWLRMTAFADIRLHVSALVRRVKHSFLQINEHHLEGNVERLRQGLVEHFGFHDITHLDCSEEEEGEI